MGSIMMTSPDHSDGRRLWGGTVYPIDLPTSTRIRECPGEGRKGAIKKEPGQEIRERVNENYESSHREMAFHLI